MPKSMTTEPQPLTEQDLADACEEMRRTTAERCAEIARSRGQPGTAQEIEGEFGLKESR